jgi:glucose/mannose-6-phosphate isomerase
MSKLTFLDQLRKVRAVDKSNMLELAEKMPDFCGDAIQRTEKVKLPFKKPKNIVVVGMGGSAIGGDMLRDWLYDRAPIPIQVCRDYVLPEYVDRDSLVIAVSYSGETEETLSAFLEALRRHCKLATISSGGHLQTFSEKFRIPHVLIPPNFPPRAAIAYTFVPLVIFIEKLNVVNGVREELEETISVLQRLSRENALQTPQKSNEAKKLATELEGTVPVIYGFRQYGSIARRLKCQFNENAKVPSKFDTFSELNHNEIAGWEGPENLTKVFSIILLRDPKEPPEIKRRIEVTKQIASSKVNKIMEIHARGKQKLTRMLSAMYVGDFASVYLAVLRGVNPTTIRTIDQLKQEMKKLNMTRELEKEAEKLG